MILSEIQKKVDLQIMSYGGYWRPLSMMLRLVEETGELARAINIKHGDKKSKSISDGREIQTELVDVFYTSVALSNFYKIDLTSTFEEDESIETIQAQMKKIKNENINYLSVLLKLISKIGKLSEIIDAKNIDSGNKEIIDSITGIITTIIEIAIEFEIDLSKEFDIKINADESKMIKVYNS